MAGTIVRRPIRILSFAVTAVVAMFFCACLFAELDAWQQRRQAQRLALVFQHIRVGATDRATVLQVTHAFRHYQAYDEPSELGFRFGNRWLARLKLSSYTEIRTWIVFQNGIAMRKNEVEHETGSGRWARVTEEKRGYGFATGIAPSDHPNHIVSGGWQSEASALNIAIEDDDTYPESERQNDWHLDFSWLTRFHAYCSDARLMLPEVSIAYRH